MEFKSGESKQNVVPFLHELEDVSLHLEPVFVDRLVSLEKGIMLISIDYKATAWIGSESHEDLLSLINSLKADPTAITKAVFMRPSTSNPKKIEVAIVEDETDKARWKKISSIVWEASEILTKKKALQRISKAQNEK